MAAIGDLHCFEGGTDMFRYAFAELNEKADALAICGDLTYRGRMSEIDVFVAELAEVQIPVYCVLGNHDYHEMNHHRFHDLLEDAGVAVLDGDSCVQEIRGHTVGFTGTKGFAGGFERRALTDFGEELWRRFYKEVHTEAEKIVDGLKRLDTDLRVAILHYAPILETLTGEDPQIYPFLGSSVLAAAVDQGGADLVLHGHSHFGGAQGLTPGGVVVRNVSYSLVVGAYALFELDWS